ncbi:L,D-transpeptidase [Chelativorans salis]|uniref:L,D-transpeptidase n=1 Tax=Chelativorans salis TaxID=2978478 RepID=A0ABT2LSH0_9HYPH|nr:L,D-transpeptidase [Chelativorans sp. EGI FJ00035]MCT7377492.1 L,D-transpeptidase [Chelativorans sp. EGI FJ00035]
MKKYSLALLLGLLTAVPALQAEEALRLPEGIQLAQVYEFDVYIDQHGREVVVDPRTGRVVEIRAPVIAAPPPPPPPEYLRREMRSRDLGRREYDFTDPRDVERFHRDREAAIREGVDPYGERGYRRPRYDDPYVDPRYGEYEEMPPVEEDYGAYPPVEREDPGIRRAPLDSPSGQGGALAAVPPNDGREQLLPGQDRGLETTIPDVHGANEEVAKYQVLLDRAGASPGVIDGRMGDNVNKAISAYHEIVGERLKTYDKEWIAAELEKTGGPAFVEYTITAEDAAGPYIASVPEDYGEKATLERLSYTRVTEMLAERFHMDEKYLVALNPDANFNRPGTVIRVANPGEPATYDVARIVADKSSKQVRVYDARGRLVAAYPATIGSGDTPSPTGTHEVARVAFDPEYTYNPTKNFKQGNNDRVLTIPPGPNGPVGSIWIALSKPTYGIHGTPEPSKIGKTYSHGCVRLTNWDAQELAKRVKPGVTVEFVE